MKAFPNKIINIHPSLFPSFLATKTAIQDALDYGVKITGITTHIIDDKVDEALFFANVPLK
ncbi:phosphoribosylglycinamide formyltransferase [Jejuia pallidilutea]|uniref:phosphoribosylglycinamide formyltransferase 1 n=1 Tax=Jejuia pallidilutea TaxID=504487 RepID=A0A090W1D8_9FLAO|nr:phosphoribosylglycinamide formyltransferase [Jejuia pallidilutea]